MSKYTATFTWPPTPSHNVFITGTFDSWSGNTHRLHKNDSTGFWEGTVELSYGEKVSYKYVVDGQWLIREDEAKEWDAIGNMNNVYTAPHAPEPTSTSTSTSHPTPTAAAAAVPDSSTKEESHSAPVPAPTAPTTTTTTESENLVSSQAPSSAVAPAVSEKDGETFEAGKVAKGESTKAGGYELGGIMLGAPLGAGAAAAAASTLIPSSHPAPIPSTQTTAAPSTVAATIPGPEVIPSAAKSTSSPTTTSTATGTHEPSEPLKALADETAPASATTTTPSSAPAKASHVDAKAVHEPADALKAIAETPAAAGAGGAGGFFASVAAAAAEMVHEVTGIDVAGTEPVSVEEAKRNGIDPVTGKPVAATTTNKAVPEPAERVSSAIAATGPAPASFTKPQSPTLPPKEVSAPASGPSATAVGSSLDSKPVPAPPVVAAAPTAAPVVAAPVSFPHTEGAPAVPAKTETGPSTAEKVASTTKQATASGSSRPSEPKEVDVFSSNTGGEKGEKGHDLPAQHETKDANHKKVPQAVITNISGPTKDRTQPSKADAANKEVTSNPSADLHAIKDQADADKANGGHEGLPSRSYAKKVEPTQAEPVAGLPLATTQQPLAKDVAPATPAKTAVNGSTGPAVVVGTPATPASRVLDRESKAAGALPSPSSSANSTPQKPVKDTSDDPMRKRKSSFFAKIKGAFHKDKSPKA